MKLGSHLKASAAFPLYDVAPDGKFGSFPGSPFPGHHPFRETGNRHPSGFFPEFSVSVFFGNGPDHPLQEKFQARLQGRGIRKDVPLHRRSRVPGFRHGNDTGRFCLTATNLHSSKEPIFVPSSNLHSFPHHRNGFSSLNESEETLYPDRLRQMGRSLPDGPTRPRRLCHPAAGEHPHFRLTPSGSPCRTGDSAPGRRTSLPFLP